MKKKFDDVCKNPMTFQQTFYFLRKKYKIVLDIEPIHRPCFISRCNVTNATAISKFLHSNLRNVSVWKIKHMVILFTQAGKAAWLKPPGDA